MPACTDDFWVGEEVLILSSLFYHRYYKLVTIVERSGLQWGVPFERDGRGDFEVIKSEVPKNFSSPREVKI